jgi:hypothetical protein
MNTAKLLSEIFPLKSENNIVPKFFLVINISRCLFNTFCAQNSFPTKKYENFMRQLIFHPIHMFSHQNLSNFLFLQFAVNIL